MPESEVLVHISAPSTVSNDAHYRAQVEAILGFRPSSRQVITLRSDDQIPDLEPTPGPVHSPKRLCVSHGQEKDKSKPPNSTTASPVQQQLRYEKDSLGTPLSVIPDSQPDRPLPDPNDLREIEPPRSSPIPRKSIYTDGASTVKRSRLQPPRPVAAEPHKNIHCLDEHPNSGKAPNDDIAISFSSSAHDDDNPAYDNILPTKGLPTLPMEIRPRLPPVSSGRFVSHITPTLAMLATRLMSPRAYNPIKQTRTLDNLERGYWYVRLSLETQTLDERPRPANPNPMIWETPLFTRFWTFLSEFIAKEGRAGWGVWCILEDAEPTASPSSETVAPPPGDPGHIKSVTLKVYAWGEITSHVYLLLFLASERHIRKMGLQWRDSADEVVIQMP
ncbi:hypothetical protein BO94DRAFT_539414 [Aspergillus sclerotioniger CBS 115572]|uniref:Acetamidase n=1 Tax=Aspergillus sclerotioniger CBS 115572 TaxID=1450535 RepID=A0A317VBT7_9EURO|nr:hypothetical protein BO94DRAFT_539414 [Aspergillus sclerotioniger CBS 115572]PWY71824.1 hypothetical protein BO94DRAFT_539414 [Aspergillus sclerotioniger CBS 115572]